MGENIGAIEGAPDGWEPPGLPIGWKYVPKNGAPTKDEIDNPSNWNLFSFAAKHVASTKKYKGHFIPANAKVLQLGAILKRLVSR